MTCDIKASTYYFILTSNKCSLSISIWLNTQCRGTQISSSCPWKNLEKNHYQRRENYARTMERRYTSEQTLRSWPDNSEKNPCSVWWLGIDDCSLPYWQELSALVSACSNKRCGLEAPEHKIHWGMSCCQHADVNNTNIGIYLVSTIPSTTLLTPINMPLVSLKVLIQSERTRWFMDGTLRNAFVQGIVRVGYSPPFFYYELLFIHKGNALVKSKTLEPQKFHAYFLPDNEPMYAKLNH